MNSSLHRFSKWYSHRSTRERLYILFLSVILIITFMQLTLLNSLHKKNAALTQSIATKIKEEIELNHKISALNKLSQTTLYKRWVQQRETSIGMKYQYNSLLKGFSIQNWHNIIKATISDTPNIQLIKIQIFSENQHVTDDILNIKNTIYEQKMQVTILSGYFETIDYLNRLKLALPHIYWNKFDYKVLQYPVATVDMEFSVFYEKNPA